MPNPAPLQTYFNPLPEAFVRDFFDDLQRNVSDDLVSVTSITISRDGTLVYYDQGENGFDNDIANPTNIYSASNLGGTQIWGDGDASNGAAPGIVGDVLNSGDVIILNNVINALVAQNNPEDAFNGGDKFASTAAVAATRLVWPQGVQSSPSGSLIGSTVLAGAVEVVDTFEYGTAFTAVIGENSDSRGSTSIFEDVRAFITAAEDNTEVFLNGTSQGTINQGQTLVIADINEADQITTTDGKAVEAHLLTGDDDGNFETRWYSLTPDANLGNDYYSPVTTQTEDFNNEFGERTLQVEYFIHNPGTSSITVNWQGSGNASGSFTVAPGTTEVINTAALPLTGSGTVPLPEDSAIRFFTDDPADQFSVVSALDVPSEDSGGRDYDWGFTLQDFNSLSTGFVTGFAFGSANSDGTLAAGNGSPIWVTAVADTTVTVDWDGNLLTTGDQQQVQVNALESVQLFDSDNDQSGARVFTTDGTLITGAYGEDASASDVGDPFIDFGYTIRSLPALSIEKFTNGEDADVPTGPILNVGETATFTYEVTNTGGIEIANVQVTDDGGPDPSFNPDPVLSNGFNVGDTDTDHLLDPGEVWQYIGTRTVTAGQYTNIATVTGDDPNGNPVAPDADPSNHFGLNPDLEITKTATSITNPDGSDGGTEVDEAGDVINYTITVENTGNVDLTNVMVDDPLLGNLTGPEGDSDGDNELDVDETWTYTGSYTVTQENIDSNGIDANGNPDGDGDIDNTATVTTDQTPPEEDDEDVPVDPHPELTLDKVVTGVDTANDGFLNAPGDIINYDLVVTNTGEVTLTNVTVTDPLTQVNTNIGDLAPNETATVSTSYAITQDDLNSNGTLEPDDVLEGQIDNTAIAVSDQTPPVTDDEDVPIIYEPGLDVIKTATSITNPDGSDDGIIVVDEAGDVINYSITVENTGNVDLTNVTVTDPLLQTLTGPAGDSDGDNQLDVDETWTYTGSYTVTQEDIDNNGIDANGNPDEDGDIDNTVTADSDQTPPETDDEDVPLDPQPELLFDKVVTGIDTAGDGILNAAGDIIDYDLVVTNTGNQTLTNVTVTDPLTQVNTNIGDLAPGASQTIATSYAITQDDLDSNGTLEPDDLLPGQIDNTATADSDQTDPEEDSEDVPLDRPIELIFDKVVTGVDTAGDGILNAAGDIIDYDLVVTNMGAVTLTNVTVTDPLTGTNTNIGDLAPGVSQTISTSYAITQDDLNSNGTLEPDNVLEGQIDNTATAVSDQTPPVTDDEDVPLEVNPDLTVIKTATSITNPDGSDGGTSVNEAGDVINYSITVENTGNIDLTNVTVTDPLLQTLTGPAGDSDGDNQLDVDEIWTYTGSYTVTQADIDNNGIDANGNPDGDGDIDNTVTADSDQTPPETDDEDVPLDPQPELLFDKVVTGIDTAGNGVLDAAGDIIDYDLVVTNIGDVTLTNVTVTDPLTAVNTNIGDLAPGVSQTISTSYTITQADIDSNGTLEPDDLLPGQIDNKAIAVSDQTPPEEDDEDVPLDRPIELIFDKVVTGVDTANDGILNAAGDIIDYDLVVTNTGAVTLTNVTVTDPLTGVNTNIGDLAPGVSQTISTSYTITQDDLDSDGTLEPDDILAGQIDNTAVAVSDQTPPVTDDEDVPLLVGPDLMVTKTADVSSVDEAGDVINYTITVENTGNTSLTNVTVDDPLLGNLTGPEGDSDGDGELDVDETWTYTGSYTVTQADIDNNGIDANGNPDGDGDIDNTVTVTTNETPPEDDNEDVPILIPGIEIEKFTNGDDADTLEEAAEVAAGDTVTWTYEVTNTGDVPFDFDDIQVTDDQGVIPVLDASTDVDSDNVLSPGETWIYTASEVAQDLNEVMDFEQFDAGDQDGTINAGLSGVTISTNWREGIMIFDSANPTGDPDDDLGTPHNNFGGPGNGFGGRDGQPGENSIPQSQVLILSQDGDPTNPNDNREGGTITFDWDNPVRVNQIGVLDVDTYEDGSTVTTFDASGNVIDSYDLQTLGNNSFQIVSMDDINVSRMEVFFSGSSAITEIDFDNSYQNLGTVTVDGVSDSDPSSYFNPFVGPKDPAPQPTPTPDANIYFWEAEDLVLDNYKIESKDFASGGELIALDDDEGSASTTFDGVAGDYDLTVNAFDEIDGQSTIKVLVNDVEIGQATLDQNLDGTRASANNLVSKTFDLMLEPGDEIKLETDHHQGERARLDSITITPDSVNLINNTPADELLSGGAGVDLFNFTDSSGDDIIENFEQGVDHLWFNINGINAFDHLNITPSSSNTLITIPGISNSSVILQDINPLTSDDVLFGSSII